MRLHQNPFYLLSVDPANTRIEINSKYEECALLSDNPVQLEEARDLLLNPRKRILAELFYFPDLSREERGIFVSYLRNNEKYRLEVNNNAALSRINLKLYQLAKMIQDSQSADGIFENEILEDVRKEIKDIITAFERINIQRLHGKINESREMAHFPRIEDKSTLESALKEVRDYYKTAICGFLNQFETKKLIKAITSLSENLTFGAVPLLLEDLINFYEIKASGFFKSEGENIETLIERIREANKLDNELLTWMVDKLLDVTRNFDFVAQPIQLYARAKGVNHDVSKAVAKKLQDLAIELYNRHRLGSLSKHLINELKIIFAEDLIFVEQLNSNLVALNNLGA